MVSKKNEFTTLFEDRMNSVEKAIEDEEFLVAFTKFGIYFEFYGFWAINTACSKKKIKLTKKEEESLKRQGAMNLALQLRIIGLMENEEYPKIRAVIAERNKIMHPVGQKGIRYLEKIDKTATKKMVEDGISCLRSFWNRRYTK